MAGFATIAALDEHSSSTAACILRPAPHQQRAAAAGTGGERRRRPRDVGGGVQEGRRGRRRGQKSGASKDEIQAKVDKLLALKKQITALDANHALAIVDKKKKAKAAPVTRREEGLLQRTEAPRARRGRQEEKKDKDPNRWAVDPAKAAAKAEKARLKALAKAEAEKADVRTPRVETTASMAWRFHRR